MKATVASFAPTKFLRPPPSLMLLVNLLVVLLGFGFFALCGYGLAFLLYSPKSFLQRYPQQRLLSQLSNAATLPKRVISLLNGDLNTAGRLFIEVRTMNPEKSEKWCWERVLLGLQRDRSASW
jgi:hypothetical protein